MKFLILALASILSTTVFANYNSEVKAIEKFEIDEFLNEKNYPPSKPGSFDREINKGFYDKLQSDATSLKYFMVLKTVYRIVDRYKKDKAFALSLESKFSGKKLTKPEWEKVFGFVADPILLESNAEHKKMLSNRANSDAHFEKHFARLSSASFK